MAEVVYLRSVEIALGGVLVALALAIPFLFRGSSSFDSYCGLFGNFSLPRSSHALNSCWARSSSPCGVASTISFMATLGPVVAARASTHILFSVATALAVKKGMSFSKALFLVGLPLHAIPEGLVVIPFGIPIEGTLICITGAAIRHT